MIELAIPGVGSLGLTHLLSDLNGTLAVDGVLQPGVAARLEALTKQLEVSLLTADTHGSASYIESQFPSLHVTRLEPGHEAEAKRDEVLRLGAEGVVFLGNGANDVLALEAAALGIAVIGGEGAYPPVLPAADLVVQSPADALDLLLYPKRIIAGLRR
ncbi:MAG TPA: ATPase P [Bacteroidetes bacterium]|nr:ATPase P [Bacteroidota bacterium]